MNNIHPEVAAKLQNFANLAERGLKQNLAGRHPELLRVPEEDDKRNEQVIDTIFLERVQSGDWQFTDENYEAAYALALQNGQLVLPEPGTIEAGANEIVYSTTGIPAQDADGRLVYPPATEAEALERMSTPEMERYFRQKYEAPRPPNAADLLPQFGERTWGYEESTLTDEQSQALRDKLLKGAGW
jgi:hypothetical protein